MRLHTRAPRGRRVRRQGRPVSPVLPGLVDVVAGRVRSGIAGLLTPVLRTIRDRCDALSRTGTNAAAVLRAMIDAITAALKGKSPLWAGLRAAVARADTRTKVLVGTVLGLTLLLGPVLLVVLLLVALIAAVASAVRARTNSSHRRR